MPLLFGFQTVKNKVYTRILCERSLRSAPTKKIRRRCVKFTILQTRFANSKCIPEYEVITNESTLNAVVIAATRPQPRAPHKLLWILCFMLRPAGFIIIIL